MKRRAVLLYQSILVVIVFIFASSYLVAQGYDSESCCDREIGTPRVKMPPDQYTDWGGMMEVSAEQYFFELPVREKLWDDCPIEVEFYDVEGLKNRYDLENKIDSIYYKKVDPLQLKYQEDLQELDYLIVGTIIPKKVTGKTDIWCEEGYEPGTKECYGGDLKGTFLFKWELVDNHHKKAIVKSLETNWAGEIHDFMGYSNPGDKTTQFNKITEITKSVANLDEIIYDYEQMPLNCKIKLEDDREYAESGEEIKINLSEIKDFKGRTAKEWQYLLVKVDKGKITNGKPCRDCGTGDEEYKIFEVGNGKVEINYKAPDECKNEKEQIFIHNTCEHRVYQAGFIDSFNPKKEIGNKEFDIICTRGYIEYNHIIKINWGGFSQNMSVVGSIPFKIKQPPKGSKDKPKVKGEGDVNFSMNGQVDECKWSGNTPTNVQLEGEISIEKEEQYVEMNFNEKWPESWPVKQVCPDEEPETMMMPVVMPVQYDKMKFKLEDGFNIIRPFQGMGGEGTYSWTIHMGK